MCFKCFFSLPTESLDELTSMVVKLFGEVENKNVPVPEFPEHPFQEEHLRVSCFLFSLHYLSHLYTHITHISAIV